jgi:DNA-binding Lrp family transcriptional regulator
MSKDSRARSQEKKDIEKLKLLFALVKCSRKSDRQLADDLGISQTTITRRRQELENEGYIKEYTIIPDLKKMGFEIIAFTFFQLKERLTPKQTKSGNEWLKTRPEIIYYGEGEGPGESFMAISVHRNYESYSKMMRETNSEQVRPPEILMSFRVNTGTHPIMSKAFSFRYLENVLGEQK